MSVVSRVNDATRYKPQFAYKTPAGYRDEEYEVPFKFTINGAGRIEWGLPWQLDDDVPFILRGIWFPFITTQNQYGDGRAGGAYVRLWDTNGNPLSDGLALTLGMWGLAGIDRARTPFGFGFPVEPEVECSVGGTIVMDIQITTNAGVAAATLTGMLENLVFFAGMYGVAGNSLTIQLIDPGANNVALSVAVVGGIHVQVTLATDGGGAITSTFQQVSDLLNSSPVTVGIMWAFIDGIDPAEIVTVFGPTALSGASASTPIDLVGSYLGVKRFKEC